MPIKCCIIIGNGFDLAHDAPTSFIDFSNWLLEDYIKRFFRIIKNNEANDFLTDEMINKFGNGKYETNGHLHVNDEFHPCFDALKSNNPDKIIELLKSNPALYKRFFNNNFITNLYSERKQNWFAIENIYYDFLCKYSEYSNTEYRKNTITQLNSQLEFLKIKLREYLKTIEFKWNHGIDQFIRKTFNGYSEVTVINFNYTDTFNLYLRNLGLPNAKIENINIHGTLKEQNEIFGYGNDLNQEYQRMKNLEEDFILENFKTVNYMMDNKYYTLINDITRVIAYDAYVLGHSLSLTDKTLLQEIFDHKHCFKIHLLKRLDFEEDQVKQKASFKSQVTAITRIMKNESDVRKKVSNFKDSFTFPVKL